MLARVSQLVSLAETRLPLLLGERPPRPDGVVALPRRRVLRSTPKHCFARPCDQEHPERTSDARRVARQHLGRWSTNARRALRRRPSRASTSRMRAICDLVHHIPMSRVCRLRGAPGVAISGNFQGDSLTRAFSELAIGDRDELELAIDGLVHERDGLGLGEVPVAGQLRVLVVDVGEVACVRTRCEFE